MTDLIASSETIAIVGMGQTGMSVARFLQKRKKQFMMFDTRTAPPNREAFLQSFPSVACVCRPLANDDLCSASKIIVSPGVDCREPAFQQAIEKKIPIIGDVQLFRDSVEQPIIAITGSNGKSTVTTLIGKMLANAGKQIVVAGNIGTPVLDVIDISQDKHIEAYVLELSSFQLESTHSLNAEVAVLLNLSADHMDRYKDLQAYHQAKQRIFFGARKVVINRQDLLSQPPVRSDMQVISFGLDKPDLKQFGVVQEGGDAFLAFGMNKLLPCSTLKIRGQHNIANALAAMAVGHLIDLPMESMLQTLASFKGLEHRCQWVRELEGVEYFNDSKGTNVGATQAAISGLAQEGKNIVLIAGGDGKGADFSPLVNVFSQQVSQLIAIGKDADQLIAVANKASTDALKVDSLQNAVFSAQQFAQSGDTVLLSPACASFDMFENYIDRGDQFCQAVKELSS